MLLLLLLLFEAQRYTRGHLCGVLLEKRVEYALTTNTPAFFPYL